MYFGFPVENSEENFPILTNFSRRGIAQVSSFCSKSGSLMQPIEMKIGSVIDMDISHDLTFSLF